MLAFCAALKVVRGSRPGFIEEFQGRDRGVGECLEAVGLSSGSLSLEPGWCRWVRGCVSCFKLPDDR